MRCMAQGAALLLLMLSAAQCTIRHSMASRQPVICVARQQVPGATHQWP